MKRLKLYLAVAFAMGGFSLFGLQPEAKADYKTLHGIADIIEAVSGGGDSYYYYDGPSAYFYDPYPRYRYTRSSWEGRHHRDYGRHHRYHRHHDRDCY